MSENKRTLVKKLTTIMQGIGPVPQTGFNNFHKYNYTTEADVQAITSNRMSEENLIMIPYEVENSNTQVTTNKGNKENLYQGTWDFKIIDGDSGEELTVRVTGHGQDSGDKAPYKAFTGAHKYALMKLFQISTGDDPERNNEPKDDFDKNVKEIYERVEKLARDSKQETNNVHRVLVKRMNVESGKSDSNITRENIFLYNEQLKRAETDFKKKNTLQQKDEQMSLTKGNTTQTVNWGQ